MTRRPLSRPRGGTEGDVALWQLVDSSGADAEDAQIDIAVSRLACASGVTGDLLDAVVTVSPDAVVVRVDAVPLGDGDYTCPSNDLVPVTVTLPEPLAGRDLVDGGCLRPEARDVSGCEGSGAR